MSISLTRQLPVAADHRARPLPARRRDRALHRGQGARAALRAASDPQYEEIVCPSVQNFLYMTDGGYTDEEILKAERCVGRSRTR